MLANEDDEGPNQFLVGTDRDIANTGLSGLFPLDRVSNVGNRILRWAACQSLVYNVQQADLSERAFDIVRTIG